MYPPALPQQSPYTSCYCEENVYLLCQTFLTNEQVSSEWDIFGVFISNPSKTVALWGQKNARIPGSVVVWDYHVVLLLLPRLAGSGSWIYDFDTTLPIPCSSQEYLDESFLPFISEQYTSLFRIIPGRVFIDNFASDRSHMLLGNGEHSSPPPDYPPIAGPVATEMGITMNLMTAFVCMEKKSGSFGDVVELDELKYGLVTCVTE